MKKFIWILMIVLLSGCAGLPLSQRDRDEFDRWRERREREKYEYRPQRPDRKSYSLELVDNNDKWHSPKRKAKPKKKYYYRPYPRRYYRCYPNDCRCS